MLYKLSYTIPHIPRQRQRGSKQTFYNMSKQDVQDWTKWLDSKIKAKYTITKHIQE